jgi:hypothetical protein
MGGLEVKLHVFLSSAIGSGEWSGSRTGRFTPGERGPYTLRKGGWADTKAGLAIPVTGREGP